MPREGAIIFRDLVGKTGQRRVRKMRPPWTVPSRSAHRENYGIDAKLFDWSDEITADCPRKCAENLYDQCVARCPDPPKVV